MYLPPPETPAASFPHKSLLFSLLPALCFCLFTEADVQQTQPGHRRDLGGESQTSQCHVVGAPHVGLELALRFHPRRERNPSPSKAGAARGGHVIREPVPIFGGGCGSSSPMAGSWEAEVPFMELTKEPSSSPSSPTYAFLSHCRATGCRARGI